ncbi:uncharacterized protein [Primulina huaijiensis]|uniref:uncharacterized protein n=1 Tax=Primulina huaijiensis TaxID=1492673 RepID=UPI003CC763A1
MPPRHNGDREIPEGRDPPPPPPLDANTKMLARMNRFFAQFAENDAAARQARPEAVYERFRRMKPKEFSGTTDPMIAEGWIKSIEVIFAFMMMDDDDKVRSLDLATLNWEGFKEVFFPKYFTEDVSSRLTREFMVLRQGDLTVAEFVRRFERGCNFVPLIANDANAKMRHFLDGLRPILRRDVRVAGPTTYEVAVSRALSAEQDLRDIENDRHGKRPFQATQSQQQHRKTFQVPRGQQQNKRQFLGTSKGPGPQQQRTNNQPSYDIPQCPNCKRRHTGECRWGSGKCYKCGSTDHMFKACPRRGQPTHGRVFTMVAEEANPDTTLLTGKIFISGVASKILIDSGATHSFISDVFASQLNVKSTRIEVNYSVLIPSGEEISANSMVKDIDLEMQCHLVYAHLILLPMPKFDVILGMDWLTRNRVSIDFRRRTVLVRPIDREPFVFEPDRFRNLPLIISCIKARKLIFKGCQAFLANIISTPEVPSQSLSDVPVVRDFTDVFPDDVAGIPPKREVEFSIDLFPVPLTSLTKKNAKFLWSTECQKRFDTLKQALITAPLLVMPSGQGNFVLYTDASKLGLGAVLMHHDRLRMHNPKEFGGNTDPFVAEGWIRSLELYFQYLDSRDGDMVRCATYMLWDDASLWWEGAPHRVNSAILSWNHFKEIFYNKYFSADVRGRLTRECMSLRQRNLSVELMLMRPATYDSVTACTFQAEQAFWDIDAEMQMKRHQAQQSLQP